MQIHRNLNTLPSFDKTVVTIGSFDGLHKGHLKIINRVKEKAREIEGESIILTFHPHPRFILDKNKHELKLLHTLSEKISSFQDLDIDHLVIVPFHREFADMNPEEYIEDFLIAKFNPKFIIIGYDHQFGKNRTGSIQLLRKYESIQNFKVIEISKQEIDQIAISSTKIRKALNEANIEKANRYLGHKYVLSGTVVHGDKIGKSLGFPTANLQISDPGKLIPAAGIYAVHIEFNQKLLKGMLYIGTKPTMSIQNKASVEINIFDFDEDIYGQELKVFLLSFIRPDQKFESLQALSQQIQDDEIKVREVFQSLTKKKIKSPEIAVVLLNFNGLHHLKLYLQNITSTNSDYGQIYLIDNASTDDSVAFVNEHYPQIKLIQLNENFGFAKGYNLGLQQINADYFVLLNTDVQCSEKWLDPLIKTLERDQQIACIQPKILSLLKPSQFEYAGAGGGFIDGLFYPFCRGRIFEHLEEDHGQYDVEDEIFWASGAALMIRAGLFKDIGGFDPDFFAHQEEIDLCWRLKNAGYQVNYCGLSKIYHLGGGTLSYDHPFKTYLNFRNNHLSYLKNERVSRILWTFPLRILLDLVAAVKFMVSGKFQNALSILKAHLFLFTKPSWVFNKRKNAIIQVVKNQIGLPNRTGKISILILWKYFIENKKEYSKIIK